MKQTETREPHLGASLGLGMPNETLVMVYQRRGSVCGRQGRITSTNVEAPRSCETRDLYVSNPLEKQREGSSPSMLALTSRRRL